MSKMLYSLQILGNYLLEIVFPSKAKSQSAIENPAPAEIYAFFKIAELFTSDLRPQIVVLPQTQHHFMNTICCLIDFTETGKKAASYAIWLAKINKASIVLMHHSSDIKNQSALAEKLIKHTGIASASIPFTSGVVSGDLKDIVKDIAEKQADLVVVGSYGTESSSFLLAAKNVVFLAQAVSVPTLVLNEKASAQEPDIKSILFPIAPHTNFEIQIEESARWAKHHNADVAVFCLAAGDDLPADINRNIELTESIFTIEGVRFSKTVVETKVYSIGYAKDIIQFAAENQFDLISIMAENSDENMYFGDVEKTNLIQNDLGIPVLFGNR